MLRTIVCENAFSDPADVTLTFELSTPNHITCKLSQGIPYTKFEHFRIFRFWVMLRTNRQTDKQTNGFERPTSTPVDRQSLHG